MPKQIATATVEGTRKRGRPRKKWRYELEEGLSNTGRKIQAGNGQWPSGMRKIVLEDEVQNGL